MQYFSYRDSSHDSSQLDSPILYECKGSKFLATLHTLTPFTQDTTQSLQDSQTHIHLGGLQGLGRNLDSQINESNTLESYHKERNIILSELKEIHKKAVHFVWAFRVLNEYGHVIEGSSDDGEPKGSAGAPMLEVLRGKCLVNTLCICVRYFGGTKLGIGGLVRAYTQAALQVVAHAQTQQHIIPYIKQSQATLHDKSSMYNRIAHLAKQHNLTIIQKDFMQADMTIRVQGEVGDIESFLHAYNADL